MLLLEAASLEEHEELRDLWGSLLANAMDPERPVPSHRFIDIVRQFEPSDAKLFEFLYEAILGDGLPDESWRLETGLTCTLTELADHLAMSNEECELSVMNLDRLGCIMLHIDYTWDGGGTFPAYGPRYHQFDCSWEGSRRSVHAMISDLDMDADARRASLTSSSSKDTREHAAGLDVT